VKNLPLPHRNFTCLVIALLITMALQQANAQQWTAFNAMDGTEPVCTVNSSTNDSVTFTVQIPGMYSETIDSLHRILIPGHNKMDSVGYPELPVIVFLVAIPDCDSVALSFFPKDSLVMNNWNIYPAPEMVVDTTAQGYEYLAEKFTYDTTCYTTDALFPSSTTELVDKGAFRSQHCIRVVIYPVKFNPMGNQLKVFSDLKIKLTFDNARGSVNEDVGIFNEIAGNTMINYESNGKNTSYNCAVENGSGGNRYYIDSLPNQKIDSTCDYIIIIHDSLYLNNAGHAAIDSLAAHRANFNGFDIAITTTSVIDNYVSQGYPLKRKIRDLIKNTYNSQNANNTYDNRLAYVNLFGDVFFDDSTVCIPTDGNGYDIYFSKLTYDSSFNKYDDYPDIMLGRCSVSDTIEMKNVAEKIVSYKPHKYINMNQGLLYCDSASNFYNVINIAFEKITEMFPGDSIFLIAPNDFNNIYPHPDWYHKTPWSISTLTDAYKKELSFFHYMGHGSYSGLCANGFGYENLNNSHNDKLPLGFFITCQTGSFHLYKNNLDCLCEQMINKSNNRGMIATIGANKNVSLFENDGYNMFHSLYYNSPIIGSANLEVQLKSVYFTDNYNLFGDPAQNLFYENIDTLKADITISNLSFTKGNIQPDDTITLNVAIKNLIGLDIIDTIITSCYYRHIDSLNYKYFSSKVIDSLEAFEIEKLTYSILPNTLNEAYYKFKIVVDSANNINELIKINNVREIDLTVINSQPLYIGNLISSTNVPLSFNLVDTSNLKLVITGSKVYNYEGDLIKDHDIPVNMFSGTGMSINDQLTYINSSTTNQTSNNSVISFTLDSLWYIEPDIDEFYGPSSIGPINNMGEDYMFFNEVSYADTNWYYSLNCIDYKCKEKWSLEDFTKILDNNPEPELVTIFPPICYYDINNSDYRIITITEDGKIFYIEENQNGVPFVADADTIDGCMIIKSPPILCDMNFDQEMYLAIRFMDTNNKYALSLTNLHTSLTDTLHLENSKIKGPWYYDFDNDGNMEIITAEISSGINYYNDQLSDSFISDTLFNKFAGFCDADNDNIPDIVYEIDDGSNKYIKSKNYLDSTTFKLPLIGKGFYYNLSDKEENSKVDILFSKTHYLGNIELVSYSKTWMWQGELGNLRNNCNFMQPAYYKANDTVYWTDNISIPDTFEIPSRTTVIVKPGTHIYAKEDAEFIVYGKLIAKGTEHHPIKFTANIMSADEDHWGGITTRSRGVAELQYCHIENATVGLFLYASSPADVESNTFKNNKVGLCAYANSPDLIENYFTQNSIAIACHASSSPKLVGGNPFNVIKYYNGIINNDTAISIYNSLPVVKDGYNDIYNDTLGVYMVFIDDFPTSQLNVRNNYYGSSDTSEVISHFSPSAHFTIAPLLDSAQTNFKSITTSPAEELLALAWTRFEEGKHQTAVQLFEQVIETYPASNEALYAITGDFEATKTGELGWALFIENMDNILQDTVINTSFEKYAFEYKNLALRIDGLYTEAIENYESIINEAVSYYDSLYAVINLSNTILESGGYKSSSGTGMVEESLLSSEYSHIIRTKELLFSQKKDKYLTFSEDQCPKTLSIYPNPAKGQFSVEFTSCKDGVCLIEIYTSSGKVIQSKMCGIKEGLNTLLYKEVLPPGIYLLRISDNGRSVTDRIIIN